MKKKDLEMKLQRLKTFQEPKPQLEQYQTPSTVASALLWNAWMCDDIEGKKVCDLGCGTGTLAIGSKLLGAEEVIGVEIDSSALKIAKENAKMLGAEVEFLQEDIQDINVKADTVVQNPPFGSQEKGNDRPFIKKALEVASVVYSLHLSKTENFVRSFARKQGASIADKVSVEFQLSNTMPWHKEEKETIKVTVFKFLRKS